MFEIFGFEFWIGSHHFLDVWSGHLGPKFGSFPRSCNRSHGRCPKWHGTSNPHRLDKSGPKQMNMKGTIHYVESRHAPFFFFFCKENIQIFGGFLLRFPSKIDMSSHGESAPKKRRVAATSSKRRPFLFLFGPRTSTFCLEIEKNKKYQYFDFPFSVWQCTVVCTTSRYLCFCMRRSPNRSNTNVNQFQLASLFFFGQLEILIFMVLPYTHGPSGSFHCPVP